MPYVTPGTKSKTPNIFDDYGASRPARARTPNQYETELTPEEEPDEFKKPNHPTLMGPPDPPAPRPSPKMPTGMGAYVPPAKGKKPKATKKKKSAASARPAAAAPEEPTNPMTAGLKAATLGLAYIPNTGGYASQLLRSVVGGAYAGQSIADAITSARRPNERLKAEAAKKSDTRGLSDEAM